MVQEPTIPLEIDTEEVPVSSDISAMEPRLIFNLPALYQGWTPKLYYRFSNRQLIPGTTLTHRQVILDTVHDLVITGQVRLSDIVWTTVFRNIRWSNQCPTTANCLRNEIKRNSFPDCLKFRSEYPLSFPGTNIDTNGGRIVQNCIRRFEGFNWK